MKLPIVSIKLLVVSVVAMCLASCATTNQNSSRSSVSSEALTITPISHTKGDMSEVLNFKASGKTVIATLQWRPYSAALDSSVTKWYGDMGRPPAKYVVKSLTVTIDGKLVNIPASKYRNLASQWMTDYESMGVTRRGRNIDIYIGVGDGSESWISSYVIRLSDGWVVAHEVIDGPSYSNLYL